MLESDYEIIRRTKGKHPAGGAYGSSGADGEASGSAWHAGGDGYHGSKPEKEGRDDHQDSGDPFCGGTEYYRTY